MAAHQPLIYLSGHVHPLLARRPDAGWMLTPQMGNRPDLQGTYWGADNGCFASPHKFNLDRYIAWLEARREYQGTCLFATAPDVLGDATATWDRSSEVLPRLRDMGYRAALVAQDGMEHLATAWGAFDVLFVGGTTEWKLSEGAYDLATEARRRGKWTHMGRVNSWSRLKAAVVSGYDSADGTYLAFGPDTNLPRLVQWLDACRGVMCMAGTQ